MAVDPETDLEYRWEDVVVFDESVPPGDRSRLLAAISSTGMLREAVFLFGGSAVRLSDIPPGGVSIRHLGSRPEKSVHRITIQTRHRGAYEVAANLNQSLAPELIQEELQHHQVWDPALIDCQSGIWNDD